MALPPWRLPIDELRWGRVLSGEPSLVGVGLPGSAPLTLVFRDGVQLDDAVVSDFSVAWDGGTTALGFEESQVLREGPLLETALAEIPGIRSLFPVRILQTFECKWRSRGVLTEGG